jgi:hypothetical protein
MKRYGLSLRRRTNLTVLTDGALVTRAVSYMQFLQNERDKMDLNMTILMDETALYFEDPHTTTIDHTGARHVVIHSTGFASMRITVVLAVTALGKKLSPLLIYKGGNSSTFEKIGSCYVVHQKKAWIDSNLLMRWVDWIFPAVNMNDGKYIVWDSMRAHISKAVKAKCSLKKLI